MLQGEAPKLTRCAQIVPEDLAVHATSQRGSNPETDCLSSLILMSALLADKHQVLIAAGTSACGLSATPSRMVAHASAIA